MEKKCSVWIKNLVIFLGLLILILFVNRATISGEKLFVTGDGFMYYLSKAYLADSIKEGALPLWNPYSSIGTPFLADVQQSVFSPFNFLYFLFETPLAFNLSRILQLTIAGFFMHLYMEQLVKNKSISIAMGCIFAFSTMLGGRRIEHSTIVTTIVFFPVILYFLEKYRNTRADGYLFGSSVCMALQFVSGFTQIVLYFDIAVFVYLISILLDFKWPLKKAIKKVFIWGTVYILLAGIQLIPTIQLIIQSGRNDISWEAFSVLAYDLRILLMMLFPEIYQNEFTAFGEYASSGLDIEIYIGIVCLIYLVYLLIYHIKEKNITVLSGIMAASFLYGMTPHIPVWRDIIYRIPLLNSFRVCARSLPLFVFMALVLSGLGMSFALKKGELDRVIKINIVFALVFAGSILIMYCVFSQAIFSLGENTNGIYYANLARKMMPGLLVVFFHLMLLLLLKKFKKDVVFYVVVACIAGITILDVSRFSLVYLEDSKQISELTNTGMDENSEKLLNMDTEEAYRSFVMMDSPEDFESSNLLQIAKYGRSVESKNNLYNAWLTFLDKKLAYWDIKENVYYPFFIDALSRHNDLVSMLGIRHVFDGWDHALTREIPDGKIEREVFKAEEAVLEASETGGVASYPAEWLEPDSCYEIRLEMESESMPTTFYVDFYGESYDDPKQNGKFDNNLPGEKVTYIFTDEIPDTQIDFRIIGINHDDITIKNLYINKVATATVLEKMDMQDSNIDVYQNINANKIIYLSDKVVPVKEFGMSWGMDGLKNVHKTSYVKGLKQTPDLDSTEAEILEIKQGINSVEALVESEYDVFLNHSQLYYPGWNVYIDGQKGENFLVNNLIQGTIVPAGRHEVEFRFEPFDVWIGLACSLAGILEIVLLAWSSKRRENR